MNKRGPSLLVHSITNHTIHILITDLGCAETIEFLGAEGIEVDGESESDEETDEGNNHGNMIALVVGHQTGQRREKRATRDRSDDPGGAALGVTAETTDGQGEDGRKDSGLEEENDGEHGNAAFAVDTHGRSDEDHDHGHEKHEDPARLHDYHGTGCGKSSNGEETLADGIAIRGISIAEVGAFDRILDELRRNADLGAHVTELGSHAEEELVLLAHGLVDVSRQAGALLGLESHIGVGDFGNGGEEEDDGEQEDESGDAEVSPLDVV